MLSCTSEQDPRDQDAKRWDEVQETATIDGQVSPVDRVERVALGSHPTDEMGLTAEVTFELPADVTAVVVHTRGPDQYRYILASFERDAGFALVPKAWLAQVSSPSACVGPCANRILAQQGYAAFLFPNTPQMDMRPGPHRLRVFAFDEGGQPAPANTQVTLSVDLVRPAPENELLRLPVNLCMTGAMGWTSSNALEQPRVKEAIDLVVELFEPSGIELGPLRVFDVSTKGQYIATQQGADSDLAELFRSGAELPNGVNIFFTERVIALGGLPGANVALGVSGGVPGPPNEIGHMRGGIAVSCVVPQGQPDLLGLTIAHELGHFLGLFHSTEPPNSKGVSAHDTLPDTAEDDSFNLMYWSVSPQARRLSHEQVQVLRRSPWLVAP